MNKLQVIKIALLIVILAEEIRNARKSKIFKVRLNVDTAEVKNYIENYKKSLE
ncbi:hypothetical protein [Staphylococcus pseudintermedius]|uniref:hypothetical protein n=1 Tax=Staphylococcus pseudintermedius TaxID=283734 RepID=UPI00145615BE|nr:hypothetical protein [Staphylococcus pseudintermedius]QKN86138.1 hypothetical protein pSpJ_33 [Staphylococcus virus pSp_SNUABM-J]EHP0489556.1 hypothetical protein [Staphylococcus pseudintermedius]EHT3650515.1 hypothetical protein [Staphylococcus pseudintermedius]EHT6218416.1 hypothetical protein [Staphylococcus pseudintermedius]EHT7731905.1 hypothetical protein [Staphylococcus pseudintermedius]